MKVSIVGASGYVGGELLRLLLAHPEVEIAQVTSESRAGKPVTLVHPNLRRRTNLRFTKMQDLSPCDFLFIALPHGTVAPRAEELLSVAPRVIDLSADFRLRDPALYSVWYGLEHPRPDLLSQFVYGLPELHRKELREAKWVSGVGCVATAAILGLAPLVRRGLVDTDKLVVDAKTGSSAGGREPSPASHHPERSGVIRSYAATGHRHTAEIEQELSFGRRPRISLSVTAVDLVRGILATCHAFVEKSLSSKDLWNTYREDYGSEPFIRVVNERHGVHRWPDPKVLAGSNYCDVGFEVDPHVNRVVVLSALDNLMKGAAGSAVQCMNIMAGFPETAGLDFAGLHP